MARGLRFAGTAAAAVGISLAATGVLILIRPDQATTLLIYLPGIAVVEALYGIWGGIAAVLLSVAGSAAGRSWYLASPLRAPVSFYATWEEETILLVVGVFVVALMELRRRSGAREASGAHQLAALLENVADAVVIFNRKLQVASMNPAALALFNRPGQAVAGASLESLRQRFSFSSADGAPLATTLADILRTGRSLHAEGVVTDLADNRRIHVLVSAAPWQGDGNRVEGALLMLTDVTALKEMQLRALDNARHVALAQMISGLTHDFNHVLDIVRRANAVLRLREEAPVEERRKYEEMIERAAQDGSGIVRRLRDYLAGGAGRTGRVDLAAVAREAVEITRPLWRAQAEIEVVEELRVVPAIQGNLDDLRRVFTNLIFNAIEALGTGGGRITVHTETGPEPGTVCAWVEDTGPGIPPDVQSRLFQPYVTTKPHGMGIGLFGAQKIVLAHGGQLSFSSAPGRGTRFTLRLPAIAEQVHADIA